MSIDVASRAALPLLLAPFLLALQAGPATAETKCTTKTYVCLDSRQGPRLCITTICTDDKGDIVSTDTIVLKDGEQPGTTVGPKGKVQLRDMNVTKRWTRQPRISGWRPAPVHPSAPATLIAKA
jgi:hypothetical protein